MEVIQDIQAGNGWLTTETPLLLEELWFFERSILRLK
jgi:hypothetical protein